MGKKKMADKGIERLKYSLLSSGVTAFHSTLNKALQPTAKRGG